MSCRSFGRREFIQEGSCVLLALSAVGLAGDGAVSAAAISGAGAGRERRYPIPSSDGVNIDRDAQVILVRAASKVFAFALACPHQNAAVKWVAKDHRFQCTKHDSRYQQDGTYTEGHTTRNLDRFPIRRDGDAVVVSLDAVFRSDQNRAGWDAAAVEV
jgi:nitrite reductase/ring-hydroxylating ferredoxin subunit